MAIYGQYGNIRAVTMLSHTNTKKLLEYTEWLVAYFRIHTAITLEPLFSSASYLCFHASYEINGSKFVKLLAVSIVSRSTSQVYAKNWANKTLLGTLITLEEMYIATMLYHIRFFSTQFSLKPRYF